MAASDETKIMAGLGENKEPIYNIQPFVSRMPHAAASVHRRLLNGEATLSHPSAHPNERHVVVGTENASGPQTMVLVDTDILKHQTMVENPVVSQTPLPMGMVASRWIGNDRLLVCAGVREESPSGLHVYRVDLGNGEFKLQESKVYNEVIREIATSPSQSNMGIYGGGENKLNLCDFNVQLQATRTFLTASGVSSVRWSPFLNGSVLSCTTEDAKLCLFDVNASQDTPAWSYQGDLAVHKALYTHCQISEYQVLLGYEDNFMEAIDIRKIQNGLNNFMTGAFDPFCHMIGDMHYREASGFLLVTGMADFSVYKHHRSGERANVAQLWSHSFATQNSRSNDSGSAYYGTFLEDNWIVCTQESTLSLAKLQ